MQKWKQEKRKTKFNTNYIKNNYKYCAFIYLFVWFNWNFCELAIIELFTVLIKKINIEQRLKWASSFQCFLFFFVSYACVCVFVSDKQEEKNYLPHAIHRGRCPRPAKYVKNSDVQICPSSVALISRPVVFDLIWKSFSIVVMTLTKYVKYIPCGKAERRKRKRECKCQKE